MVGTDNSHGIGYRLFALNRWQVVKVGVSRVGTDNTRGGCRPLERQQQLHKRHALLIQTIPEEDGPGSSQSSVERL